VRHNPRLLSSNLMTNSGFLSRYLIAAFAALFITGLVTLWVSPLMAIGALVVLVVGLVLGHQSAKRLGKTQDLQVHEEILDELGESGFSSKLLTATINEMREGLIVIDQEMRVVASNKAARGLFTDVEEPINSRRLTELTRNPAIYDAFLDAVRGIERAGVKVETYGPGKRIFDLRVVPLNPAHRQNPSGAVGVFFDVTRLERLEIVRQEFLSNVSHELRTPLTSIIALAETLEAGAIDDDDNNRRFLSIIQKNATRMHRLIDDILELSAIEAGNVKVSPEIVRLRPLVEDVVGSLSAAAALRDVRLRNEVDGKAIVFADPHRLVQMITNLVDNAIKFNRDPGEVMITHERKGRDRIHVEDTGEGIPAHHVDRLFERFYRVDRARSRELGGTGLGLAIVKHLVRAHGGEIVVDSRFGEGTRFTIELPFETGGKPAEPDQLKEAHV
jgi:two-component system, OmpR family, phosphate regulon sensor histidine kinase PhoR